MEHAAGTSQYFLENSKVQYLNASEVKWIVRWLEASSQDDRGSKGCYRAHVSLGSGHDKPGKDTCSWKGVVSFSFQVRAMARKAEEHDIPGAVRLIPGRSLKKTVATSLEACPTGDAGNSDGF